jgi:hypothetical protein
MKTLVPDTATWIAEHVEDVLNKKGQYFTVISYFPAFPHRQPKVRTSQRLCPGKNGPKAVRVSADRQHLAIDAQDMTWGFLTENSSSYPKFEFERYQFTVEEIVPCGDMQRHIFAVEDHSE